MLLANHKVEQFVGDVDDLLDVLAFQGAGNTLVGTGLGLVIGFKLRRDQLNAADDLLAQLKELKATE